MKLPTMKALTDRRFGAEILKQIDHAKGRIRAIYFLAELVSKSTSPAVRKIAMALKGAGARGVMERARSAILRRRFWPSPPPTPGGA